ncbi:MAG TPA: glycosyltransferase family 4 protein, partial [Longimicrobiaceae bacterium]|nr:glycosyltransferase family 4 protein [Longimicrobiaceae bacterium]
MRALLPVLTFDTSGGLEIYTREVASALHRLGHDVEVWSLLESGGASAPEGVRIRHLRPSSRLLASLHHRALTLRTGSALRRHRERFDLILCMHPMLAVGTARALGSDRPPYWVWTYGTDIWGNWSPELERALAGAQKIATISRYTAGRIWSRLPEADIPIIYPTLSTQWLFEIAEPMPARAAGRPVLLTVSRLDKADSYKGHDKVIASLPRIAAALGSPIEYRVVGTGDGLDRLRALARQHGVSEHVRFLGRVSEQDLVREFHSCDLFVMPSRMDPAPGGSFRGEGFGIVYIEAAAVGKPVIASDQAAAPEAIRDGITGLVVDPSSEEAIAQACVRILSSGGLARAMGEEGRRWVRSEFSREAFDRRLAAALE